MEIRVSAAGGLMLAAIAVGASILSFTAVAALWAFALALGAIACGIAALLLLRGASARREPLSVVGLGGGVIGIILGAIKAISWALTLIIR